MDSGWLSASYVFDVTRRVSDRCSVKASQRYNIRPPLSPTVIC